MHAPVVVRTWRPPGERIDPRDELLERERLDEVVIGARPEPGDAVIHRVARRQHQDRRSDAPFAKGARNIQPVRPGQHQSTAAMSNRPELASRGPSSPSAAVSAVWPSPRSVRHEGRKPSVVLDQQDLHAPHRPRSGEVCRASLPISNGNRPPSNCGGRTSPDMQRTPLQQMPHRPDPYRPASRVMFGPRSWMAVGSDLRAAGRVRSVQILLIEDDTRLSALVADRLRAKATRRQPRPADWSAGQLGRFDMRPVNVMLPRWTVNITSTLHRERGVTTPILMLTAHNTVDRHIAAPASMTTSSSRSAFQSSRGSMRSHRSCARADDDGQ